MSKRKDGHERGKYTPEFKLEAVRLVKSGQAVPVTAKILGVPTQTLGNWVRLSSEGQLKGADDKPVSPEQIELDRLSDETARVKKTKEHEADFQLLNDNYYRRVKEIQDCKDAGRVFHENFEELTHIKEAEEAARKELREKWEEERISGATQ